MRLRMGTGGAFETTVLVGGGQEVTFDGQKVRVWLPSEVVDDPRLFGCWIVAPESVERDGFRVAVKGQPVPWETAREFGWVSGAPHDDGPRTPLGMYATTEADYERHRQAIAAHYAPGELVRKGDRITVTAEVWGVKYTFTADLANLGPHTANLEEYMSACSETGNRAPNAGRQLIGAVLDEIRERYEASKAAAS